MPDGSSANSGTASVRWTMDSTQLVKIQFELSGSRGPEPRSTIQRIRSSQFTLVEEAIGQIFHELVLIPSIYFEPT